MARSAHLDAEFDKLFENYSPKKKQFINLLGRKVQPDLKSISDAALTLLNDGEQIYGFHDSLQHHPVEYILLYILHWEKAVCDHEAKVFNNIFNTAQLEQMVDRSVVDQIQTRKEEVLRATTGDVVQSFKDLIF